MFIDNLINSVSADWISIIFIAALDIRNKKKEQQVALAPNREGMGHLQ